MNIHIKRDFEKTERDDFNQNVLPLIADLTDANPIYNEDPRMLVGWLISKQNS